MLSLEYLEAERLKIWERITELEIDLSKRTPEVESEAKQHSKKASEFRNRSEEAKDAAIKSKGEAEQALESIKSALSVIEEHRDKIIELATTAHSTSKGIDSDYQDLLKRKEHLEKQIADLEEIFSNEQDVEARISQLEEYYSKGSELSNKVSTAHRLILEKKSEIDSIYYEIVGYTEEAEQENEEVVVVKGLKGELAESYNEIKARLEEMSTEFKEFEKSHIDAYVSFSHQRDLDFQSTIKGWDKNYQAVNKRIQDLLPQALTAGLSYAYSEKKDNEVKESERLGKSFNRSIFGLIGVSCLPFIVAIIELFNDTTFRQVILDIPRVVLAIFPLYVPILWMAYSANKKRNLSKRLIEEYTHKEVLSKTYEGLSRQINSIEDKEVSEDLRNKLLYTILEVSSENPGKLISDYQKSDHPLMDALDKSVQLGGAVDKLSKLPGFSRLAKILERRSQALIEKSDKLANQGLDQIELSSSNDNGINA